MEREVDYAALEQRAKKLYSEIQDVNVPDRFKNPSNFSTQKINPNSSASRTANGFQNFSRTSTEPKKSGASMFYTTSNSEYGDFTPSIVEMPTQWNGNKIIVSRQQNNVVYKYDGFNTEIDKNRYMDPYVTIRRK